MWRFLFVAEIVLLAQAQNTTVQTTTHTDGAFGLEHACKFSSDDTQLIRRNRALSGLYFVDMPSLEEHKVVTGRWMKTDTKLTYYFQVGSNVPEDKQVNVAAIKFRFTDQYRTVDDKDRLLTRDKILIRYIGLHVKKFSSHIRRDEYDEKVIFWGFRKLI